MSVSYLDLRVKKGTKVVQPVQVLTAGVVEALPVGTKARMKIRTSVQSEIIKADMTTENGHLAVDALNALVTITMQSAYTATFDFERGVYDLFLIFPDNEQEPIAEGTVYVMPSVTR